MKALSLEELDLASGGGNAAACYVDSLNAGAKTAKEASGTYGRVGTVVGLAVGGVYNLFTDPQCGVVSKVDEIRRGVADDVAPFSSSLADTIRGK